MVLNQDRRWILMKYILLNTSVMVVHKPRQLFQPQWVVLDLTMADGSGTAANGNLENGVIFLLPFVQPLEVSS